MLLPPPLDPASAAAAPIIAHDAPRLARRAPKTTVAFVDLETTGLDPSRHDIIEIGIVRVDARTLEVLDEYEALVAPERLGEAQLDALAINGFTTAAWEHALPLREALLEVAPLLEGALVAGHNVGFDWAFLEAGFRRAGLALPNVDYHRLDTASLAWPLVVTGELPSMSLDPLAKLLGLERPHPHRALADARCSLEVARRLVERMRAGGVVTGLPADERQICDALLGRLAQGRRQYGPWRLDDGRDYPSEAYAEVLDGLHYTAAELVRRRRIEAGRRRRVYVCHPFANDPAGNIERVRAISQFLIDDGALPIAPHLYLPQLIDETTGREQALALCLELLATCDEVRVFGELVTEGMERELREAKRLGLPAHFVREVRA
ncbi:MAG: 3'-5' exonuclease [Myxococcales bacterium]|nr:3'-5' exonuclease [Myxococcales bacterium]